MNREQLANAEALIKELSKLERENDEIREFADKLQGGQYLRLITSHQTELELKSEDIFKLIGSELVDLLRRKLKEREERFSNLTAEDLFNPPI